MSERTEIERALGGFEREDDAAAEGGEERPAGAADPPDESRIRRALRTVIDPEIGLDVVTLGLIYQVSTDEGEPGRVRITHTLTTPGCPMEAHLRNGIRRAVEALPGVERAVSDLVWEPRWHPGMIEDDAW